ncbi:hypothetical protein Taro_037260 [Colocasia esculenta]|uniref:Uncharacterized protein n=1 Tax=Colocasia esculenta TaxID=4460 RepID=A0A843VZZ9_COLES|nr:hypothetical protein [Colocasia esculenta]
MFSHGDRNRPRVPNLESTLQPSRHKVRFGDFRSGSQIPLRAADVIAYGHPFAQTGITFRSVIRIAYKTPIRNRHSESLVAPLLPREIRRHFGVKKLLFRTPKLRFWPTISPFQRFSHSNVSLDHVNPGWGGHTELVSHGDRKLCSTRCENSSPGRRYGCTNIVDIVTPFGNVSLHHVNPGRGGHTESASHGDRKLCSTRRENSSPGFLAVTSPSIT